jgi:hypothetical protein
VRQSPTSGDPLTDRHRCIDVEDLHAPVVRMATRSDVPLTDELGVHHHQDPPTEPVTAGPRRPHHHVRARHVGFGVVEADPEQIDRELVDGTTVLE